MFLNLLFLLCMFRETVIAKIRRCFLGGQNLFNSLPLFCIMKKRMNCTRIIWRKGQNSYLHGAKLQAQQEINKFCPPNSSDDLCIIFCINPSSIRLAQRYEIQRRSAVPPACCIPVCYIWHFSSNIFSFRERNEKIRIGLSLVNRRMPITLLPRTHTHFWWHCLLGWHLSSQCHLGWYLSNHVF